MSGLTRLLRRRQRGVGRRAAGRRRPSAAGLTAAFGDTFWWALAFTAVAVLPTLRLPAGARRR